jgi:glycosyltransferase involved in cell wall biosynthesis
MPSTNHNFLKAKSHLGPPNDSAGDTSALTAELSTSMQLQYTEAAPHRSVPDGRQPRTRSHPLRVLHVIPHLGGGGSERFVLTLLPLLHRSVCDPMLCVLGSINAFPSRTEGVGPVRFLGYDGSLRDLRGMRRCVRSLREIIVENNVDIVHSHLWPAARSAASALRCLPVGHIVQVQDTRPWLCGRSLKARFLRAWTNRAIPPTNPTYLAVSDAVRVYTCRNLAVDETRISVIPNGVDLTRFRPKPAAARMSGGRVVIGMVARMESEKGHRGLIDVVARLAKEGLDLELRLAGDGSLRPQLEAVTKAAGIAQQVVFAGLVDDVESFLHELDIFVLTSVFGEGLPLAILEAMACRLPVIACDVAGAGEVIRNGENGILVPSMNSAALGKAIHELAIDPERREALSSAGLKTVRANFSLQSVARRIEAIYSAV